MSVDGLHMKEPRSGAKTLFGKLFAFAFAGGTGMIVDLGVLRLLIEMGATPFLARIPAIGLAMATTWFINRNFTFGASGRSVRAEGSRYATIAIIGAFLNYAIYSAILIVTPDGFLPEFATIIAVGIVTIFSYLGYSRFVFKDDDK